jgi:hypothetical protein
MSTASRQPGVPTPVAPSPRPEPEPRFNRRQDRATGGRHWCRHRNWPAINRRRHTPQGPVPRRPFRRAARSRQCCGHRALPRGRPHRVGRQALAAGTGPPPRRASNTRGAPPGRRRHGQPGTPPAGRSAARQPGGGFGAANAVITLPRAAAHAAGTSNASLDLALCPAHERRCAAADLPLSVSRPPSLNTGRRSRATDATDS